MTCKCGNEMIAMGDEIDIGDCIIYIDYCENCGRGVRRDVHGNDERYDEQWFERIELKNV